MGQLFLWTQKIDETSREEFSTKFGFDIPETLLELHENLPEEFMEFLGFYPIEQITSEENRSPMMMPGLIPFGQESDGDSYCFYLPWNDDEGNVPIGIWLQETNHFLPISNRMSSFLMWWMIKTSLDSIGTDDWDEMRRILELFKGSCNLEEFDFSESPPQSTLLWHENLLEVDPRAVFSLNFIAANQFSIHGIDTSLDMLQKAEEIFPGFGASSIWQARLLAMGGQVSEAHQAYWRHLRSPMFCNGYHYWWHAGDLQIQETSELEAVHFFDSAEIPPPSYILDHPKVQMLRERDLGDYKMRLELAEILENSGDYTGALIELENAFFIQSWDDKVAQEILGALLSIYPEHNRIREAEQCRRALAKLRLKSASPYR